MLPFLEVSGHISYGKEMFRLLLDFCTCIAIILIVMHCIFHRKSPFNKRKVMLLVFVAGVFNGIAHYVFASNLIGAFYERNDYSSEKYDAYIYNSAFENDDYTFCIATISHHKGISVTWEKGPYFFIYDNYFLEKIELPYGCIRDNLFSFYPDGKYGIALEHLYPSFVLEINDIATSESYEYLKKQILSVDGEIVGSLNGTVYHLQGCSHADQIKSKNIVRFNSPIEAEFYGYRMCADCMNT